MKKKVHAIKQIEKNNSSMQGASKYLITQIKSAIGTSPSQKLFLKSLGLTGIGTKAELPVNASSTSLLKKVNHLIKVEV